MSYLTKNYSNPLELHVLLAHDCHLSLCSHTFEIKIYYPFNLPIHVLLPFYRYSFYFSVTVFLINLLKYTHVAHFSCSIFHLIRIKCFFYPRLLSVFAIWVKVFIPSCMLSNNNGFIPIVFIIIWSRLTKQLLWNYTKKSRSIKK